MMVLKPSYELLKVILTEEAPKAICTDFFLTVDVLKTEFFVRLQMCSLTLLNDN